MIDGRRSLVNGLVDHQNGGKTKKNFEFENSWKFAFCRAFLDALVDSVGRSVGYSTVQY